jgi:Seven in absentia protein family
VNKYDFDIYSKNLLVMFAACNTSSDNYLVCELFYFHCGHKAVNYQLKVVYQRQCISCGFARLGEDIVFLATDINLAGAVDWVMMQTCFGHHFMLVLEKQEKSDSTQMFYTIVQLIGTRKQAESFIYR